MKYNFNAGPSMLPREVIEATAAACLDFEGSGLSLMEISHRAKNFQPVVDKAVELVKELLDLPEGYAVVFLAGGASTEFCRVPYNFLEKKAAYLNTGTWAKKAMKEAKLFGEVVEVASSADDNYTYIPKEFDIPADADYLHITSNNTIFSLPSCRIFISTSPSSVSLSSMRHPGYFLLTKPSLSPPPTSVAAVAAMLSAGLSPPNIFIPPAYAVMKQNAPPITAVIIRCDFFIRIKFLVLRISYLT